MRQYIQRDRVQLLAGDGSQHGNLSVHGWLLRRWTELPRMLDMHMEELVARLTHYHLALPFSDMDGIRIFLHLLLHELTTPGVPHVKYVRLCSRARGDSLFQLVCWCTLSIADEDGRVVEVMTRSIPLY